MRSFTLLAVAGPGIAGFCLVLASVLGRRRPTLRSRLDNYLPNMPRRSGAGLGAGSGHGGFWRIAAGFVSDSARSTVPAIARRLGMRGDLDRLLIRAGSEGHPARHMARRARWCLWSAGAAMAVGAFGMLSGTDRPMLALVMICVAPGGSVLADRKLAADGDRRMSAIMWELPVAVDMTALAISAGETLRGALELAATHTPGPLGAELRRLLVDARSGMSLRLACEDFARRVDVPAAHRFVDAIGVAAETGTPLEDTLSNLSGDLREQARRRLLVEAGRRQVTMLMPIVGLMLPAVLLFAFWPALVSLQQLVRA